MNVYDHEDAFKDANLCAGSKVKLSEALKSCQNKDLASVIIHDTQQRYRDLFDAFIEGVEYGRRNPAQPTETGET